MSARMRPKERPHEADQHPAAGGAAASAQRSPAAHSEAPAPSPADLEAPPDHPAHVPAGDPERRWRKRRRWLDAPSTVKPSLDALRGKTADQMLDVHFAAAEFLRMASDPEVAAYGQLMIDGGLSILTGKKDPDGRAVPLGRILRLQPASGGTAAPAITKAERDNLIRKAREAVPEWRDARPYTAAKAMRIAFERYAATGYAQDRTRSVAGMAGAAPATEPRASFFRLCRLAGRPGGAFPTDAKTLVAVFGGT